MGLKANFAFIAIKAYFHWPNRNRDFDFPAHALRSGNPLDASSQSGRAASSSTFFQGVDCTPMVSSKAGKDQVAKEVPLKEPCHLIGGQG
jgi:hypothetical protein